MKTQTITDKITLYEKMIEKFKTATGDPHVIKELISKTKKIIDKLSAELAELAELTE